MRSHMTGKRGLKELAFILLGMGLLIGCSSPGPSPGAPPPSGLPEVPPPVQPALPPAAPPEALPPVNPIPNPPPPVPPVEPPAPTNTYTYAAIADQPMGVSEAQGEVVGGQLYVFGGFDKLKNCCTPTNRAQRYDPATNRWTALTPMPDGGVTHAGMTTDGSDIYYAGGYGANAAWTAQVFGTRAVWRYNVAQDSYAALPALPVPSAAGQLEYLDGKLHYFGGTDPERTQDLKTHYVLDVKGGGQTWTSAAPLAVARNHLGSAVLGGRIYAIGGQTGHDARLTTVPTVEAYDPATGGWTALAPLPQARSHTTSSTVVLGGRILVVGGETSHNVPSSAVTAYDPLSGTWTALSPLPQARVSGVAGAFGRTLVFTGGNSQAGGWQASPVPAR